MRYQQIPYSCGAAAVVNALRCFGMKVSERIIRARGGTTFWGTSDKGIVAALESYGFVGIPFDIMRRRIKGCPGLKIRAMDQLSVNLNLGNPVIICTQNLEHWVTVIGKIGERFVLVDSANTMANKKENSIHVLSQEMLSKIWKSKKGVYSGIVVKKLS